MLYYFPNRPLLLSIDNPAIDVMDQDPDWSCEVKKNGSRLCLHYDFNTKQKSFDHFVFYERHKKIMNYTPSKEVLDELKELNLPTGTHIDAELLDKKTKHIKNWIYMYDIYQYDGKLIMDDLESRRSRLHDIFKGRTFEHLEIAKVYPTGFRDLYNKVILNEEDEGIVMKNCKGKIEWNTKTSPDVYWQIKARRPQAGGNYKF